MISGNNTPRLHAETSVVSGAPAIEKLARLICAYAPHDGGFELRIPGLNASRFSRVNKECVHALRLPSLCIVAQGAKTVIVGQEVYEYDASQMIVFSVALPVAAQITQASHSEPYLALRLDLDPHKIAELVLKVYPHGLRPGVGYLSASQFSREYSRFFGSAPTKDIARLRQDTRPWV